MSFFRKVAYESFTPVDNFPGGCLPASAGGSSLAVVGNWLNHIGGIELKS